VRKTSDTFLKGEKKTIIQLKLSDEMEIEDQEIVEREEEDFYTELYMNRATSA